MKLLFFVLSSISAGKEPLRLLNAFVLLAMKVPWVSAAFSLFIELFAYIKSAPALSSRAWTNFFIKSFIRPNSVSLSDSAWSNKLCMVKILASYFYVGPWNVSCHSLNILDIATTSLLFSCNFISILAKNFALFSLIALTFYLYKFSKDWLASSTDLIASSYLCLTF